MCLRVCVCVCVYVCVCVCEYTRAREGGRWSRVKVTRWSQCLRERL